MRTLPRVIFGLLLFLLPLGGLALAPSGVSGIFAERTGARILVRWAPARGDIAYYRVYWSTESILLNAGEYADFEQTDGPETEHALEGAPASGEVFLSVLAVNHDGEESSTFLEEARLGDVAAQSASSVYEGTAASSMPSEPEVLIEPALTSSVSASSDSSAANPQEFHLLSVQANSPTTVVFTFSQTVSVAESEAAGAAIVTDQRGQLLPGTRLTIEGPVMTLKTLPQNPGAVYIARLSGSVLGQGPDGESAPLGKEERLALFTGFGTGTAPPAQAGAAWDVQNLTLRAQKTGDTFTVEAIFADPNPSGSIAYYEALQTWDRGNTLSAPTQLPIGTVGARLDGLPPGEFGLLIRTMSVYGVPSRGVLQTIVLGEPTSTPSVPPKTEQPAKRPARTEKPMKPTPTPKAPENAPHPKGLSQSGATGVAAAVLGTTGILAWKKRRKHS